MSYHFDCPEAPHQQKALECQCVDMRPHRGEPSPECGACDGTGIECEVPVSEAPEFSLSNGNARIVLPLAGIEPEPPHGVVDPSAIPQIRRQILVSLNDGERLDRAGRERTEERASGDDGGVSFVEPGTPAEYLEARLRDLDELLSWAQERGHRVTWG